MCVNSLTFNFNSKMIQTGFHVMPVSVGHQDPLKDTAFSSGTLELTAAQCCLGNYHYEEARQEEAREEKAREEAREEEVREERARGEKVRREKAREDEASHVRTCKLHTGRLLSGREMNREPFLLRGNTSYRCSPMQPPLLL